MYALEKWNGVSQNRRCVRLCNCSSFILQKQGCCNCVTVLANWQWKMVNIVVCLIIGHYSWFVFSSTSFTYIIRLQWQASMSASPHYKGAYFLGVALMVLLCGVMAVCHGGQGPVIACSNLWQTDNWQVLCWRGDGVDVVMYRQPSGMTPSLTTPLTTHLHTSHHVLTSAHPPKCILLQYDFSQCSHTFTTY